MWAIRKRLPVWRVSHNAGSSIAHAASSLGADCVCVGTTQRCAIWHLLRGNVLKELVEKSGGRIEIRNIRVGDPTMSVLEIYVAEYQERNGFLINPLLSSRDLGELPRRNWVSWPILSKHSHI